MFASNRKDVFKGARRSGHFRKKGKGNKIHYILNQAYRQLPAMMNEIDLCNQNSHVYNTFFFKILFLK
jgi:hypothetical protein